ncbi:MAG: hypothetical protein IKI05_03445 [Bacteroidaceae bacterium]|nr:hypothetical protein [Bacteroidaceae bacterium]
MGKYPLTASERARFDRMWNGMSAGRKATAVLDFDHFCSWLRGEDSSFYYSIRDKLRDLWEEVKSTIGDIAEGAFKAYASVAVTPIVAVVEGVKEGFNNGFEAGIDKAFEEGKKFLKDLWD